MRALLSVSNKDGLLDFARGLVELGCDIISTGGTERTLREAGVPVTPVSTVTGFPEILDGRVKTLHPAIHGGLLARRNVPEHMAALEGHGITPIDLVAINLYPFAETIARDGVTLEEATEQIDIGGPAMIRAAAKNFASVTVVVDPADYATVLAELRAGQIGSERRRALAARAFAHVAAYDTLIADYLRGAPASAEFPEQFTVGGEKVQDLRYGENPHQRAAAYKRLSAHGGPSGILDGEQLHGKELSFNNLLDADAAWSAIRAFEAPAVSIIKHTIPCGLAVRPNLADAFAKALEGDPVSAFGGIVALNRPVDDETAKHMAEVFFEVVIAPGFTEGAIETLGKRKNLRLLRMPERTVNSDASPWDVRVITGGLLVQDADTRPDATDQWRVVTKRQPSEQEWRDLRFAWKVARHVKSNAIVIAKDESLLGVGSGQPNRLESVRIASKLAGEAAQGAVLASDAFFPFPDGVEAGLRAGVTAIVQPGGSVRDEAVIAAADAAGATMVFTGTRHFRH